MVFLWILSDSNSPQDSKPLLNILAEFFTVVVWIVSTCALISLSSSSFNNPLGMIPRVPITIGITITF